MSDSSRPHVLQPTRLLHQWDFPGKSTGVGYHCFLQIAFLLLLLLLSHFSRVRPPSLGFSRQEHWSGLPFPSPMHESESEVAQSCLTLLTAWTAAHQAPPSMGFSRQEHWSGVPCYLCPILGTCIQIDKNKKIRPLPMDLLNNSVTL